MAELTPETILNALKQVKGPDFESDIVTLGLVSDIFITDARVFFAINVPAERAQELEPLRLAAEKIVAQIDGVSSVLVTLTAEKKPGSPSLLPPSHLPTQKKKIDIAPARSGAPAGSGQRRPPPPRAPLNGVNHIIAVASGKGGVGKSTAAINLSLGLSEQGLKIGLLDGDIYGPSLPRLVNLHEKVQAGTSKETGKKLLPHEHYGLKLMSMGFLVDEEMPVVWRGPMVMSAITQMLRDVLWAPLDILVVDMPPGTGDAQLTLASQVPLAGAVIISTPQDLALIDARKGIEMFAKVGVPILGIIENMSYFIAPDTGKKYDIFGNGGARIEANKRKIDFLGEVPLDPTIRIASDEGDPIILRDPKGAHATLWRQMAAHLAAKLGFQQR